MEGARLCEIWKTTDLAEFYRYIRKGRDPPARAPHSKSATIDKLSRLEGCLRGHAQG